MLAKIQAFAAPVSPARQNALSPMDLRNVRLDGGLLGEWQQTNRAATIGHCIARLESSGVLDNLRRLVDRSDSPFRGPLFADSDLYKTLEAVGWEAVRGDTAEFAEFVDESIALLAAVQEPDGYLDSYYQGPHAGERFTDLPQGHELYKLGHLVQAAIAWHHAGRDDLLQIALRYVELVHTTFGAGGRDDLDGHPEIETALVELSRITGDPRHRELARRLVELRGHRTIGEGAFGAAYYQDTVPVRESREATGHAVRQLYLLAGVADLELDDDSGYGPMLGSLWHSVHDEKMYVTGGLGSRHRGESFGDPYELPSDRAYSETCAAIANFHWNWRMLLLRGDTRYADEMERGLYNAIAVSTSVDGCAFFYSNPLHLRTGHTHEEDAPSTRLDWYECACCPPNLARLLSSLSGYLATTTEDAVQFHLYTAGDYDLGDGVTATVTTDYPWDASVQIVLDAPATRAVELRVPGWAHGAQVTVDGVPIEAEPGQYATAPVGTRQISLLLPVEPVIERGHPWIDAVRGTVALRRGPVFFCLESADLPEDVVLEDVVLPAAVKVVDGDWNESLGVPTLRIEDAIRRPAVRALYRTDEPQRDSTGYPLSVTAIPYFRWANRAPGAMRVWVPTS